MDKIHVDVSRRKLAAFCRKHHIRKLAFFGSVLRDDFKPTSDVDVLVEFEKGYTSGFAFFSMSEELKKILGREVDLHTYSGVSAGRNPIRCRSILNSAKVYYVARRRIHVAV
jgi:uncharacterized protein